jgi:F0F1-type ATP synthase delta subunit
MSYNPKLLGGLIVEYGSSSVDASILKEFSLSLAKGKEILNIIKYC